MMLIMPIQELNCKSKLLKTKKNQICRLYYQRDWQTKANAQCPIFHNVTQSPPISQHYFTSLFLLHAGSLCKCSVTAWLLRPENVKHYTYITLSQPFLSTLLRRLEFCATLIRVEQLWWLTVVHLVWNWKMRLISSTAAMNSVNGLWLQYFSKQLANQSFSAHLFSLSSFVLFRRIKVLLFLIIL